MARNQKSKKISGACTDANEVGRAIKEAKRNIAKVAYRKTKKSATVQALRELEAWL